MFYWTTGRYHYHGNTAGSKPALNIGFDLFSENSDLDFFHHLSLENSEKYLPIDTGLVKFWQRDFLLFCV